MGNVIAVLAIVALVVYGIIGLGGALDSMAEANAAAAASNAWATVNVAQIQSDTQIRMQELAMLDSAYTRAMLAVFFWPVAAIISLFMAAGMWFMVWKESRRQKSSGYESGGGYRYRLPDSHQFPVQRYSDFERETLQMEKEYRQRYG